MQTEQLIKMANQIGDFYESYPNQQQAQVDIAGHLNKFWAISMRKQLALHVSQTNGQGLHPQVASAIAKHLHI